MPVAPFTVQRLLRLTAVKHWGTSKSDHSIERHTRKRGSLYSPQNTVGSFRRFNAEAGLLDSAPNPSLPMLASCIPRGGWQAKASSTIFASMPSSTLVGFANGQRLLGEPGSLALVAKKLQQN